MEDNDWAILASAALPKRLNVGGTLDLRGTAITALPAAQAAAIQDAFDWLVAEQDARLGPIHSLSAATRAKGESS